MTNPYEEKNTLSLPDVPVAVRGDKTTSCGSCRAKMAQATFDMTAGAFFPDSSLQEVYPEQRIQPIEYDNPIDELYSRNFYMPSSAIPINDENNPIDELYGRTSQTTPQTEKMEGCGCGSKEKDTGVILSSSQISPPPFDPIGPATDYDHSRDNLDATYRGSRIDPTGEPCGKLQDGTFQFPGDKYFPEKYLDITINQKNLITKNCKLFFIVEFWGEYRSQFPPGSQLISIVVEVDVKECCSNLVRGLWCVPIFPWWKTTKSTDETQSKKWKYEIDIYKIFSYCLEKKIYSRIMEEVRKLNLTPDSVMLYLAEAYRVGKSLLAELDTSIFQDHKKFINEESEFWDEISGYKLDHLNSCLCKDLIPNNPKGYLPTYCCLPDKDPDNCYCEGELRNLCE